MRISYYCFPKETPLEIIDKYCENGSDSMSCSVSFAKKMLKQYGGHAWTEHIDRVTEIKLDQNNSKFKYNHHL